MAEKEYIGRESVMRSLEFITNDPTCPIHIAACIDQIIAQEPAADVVEVRYGKWEEQLDGTHYCSECGYDATYTYDGAEVCGIACPYCGAKMDGGKER